MIVTENTHPALHGALVRLETDNGGHLLGTVYPGDPVNLNAIVIPFPWELMVSQAEAALAGLKLRSVQDYETVACGERSDMEALVKRYPELCAAARILEACFDGFPSAGDPGATEPASGKAGPRSLSTRGPSHTRDPNP
jgi:hypothetical protein